MNLDEFYQQIQATRYRSAKLCQKARKALVQQQELLLESFEELYAALDELQIAYQELHQQNEELVAAYEAVEVERHRYYNLVELLPDAYVVTDVRGIIQEANCSAARLLNVPQKFLVRKPLIVFISKEEHRAFFINLNRLHQSNQVWEWATSLCPRQSQPCDVTMKAFTLQHRDGKPRALGWLLYPIKRELTEINWGYSLTPEQDSNGVHPP